MTTNIISQLPRVILLTALATALSACAQNGGNTTSAGNSATSPSTTNNQSVPDFSGTYDTATLTPLQRPKAFGNKQTMTRAEADKIAAAEAAIIDEAAKSSDPDRDAPVKGGDGNEASGAGGVGGYNLFWIDRGEENVTVNGEFRTSIITSPANGRIPDMTAPGLKRFMVRRSLFRPNTGTAWWVNEPNIPHGPYDGPETLSLAERCIIGFGSTGGPPMLPVLYNNHKRIVQTPDHVMIQVEMIHDARIVRLNSEHKPAHLRSWLGDSIGHFEGNTLVVDTTNFTNKPALYGADENLHVIERFTRLDDGTLLYQFEVDDPSIWTETWSGEYSWEPTDEKVYEYACHEGNYAMGNILRGARILESEAPSKALKAAGN